MHQPVLSTSQLAFLVAARRAVLATIAPDGHARLVPVCFVVETHLGAPSTTAQPAEVPVAWIPLDDKPKAVLDVRKLARVRDILDRPPVTLLVDHWSEDWSRLAWVRCEGRASLVEPGDLEPGGHARILDALRAKHPQYRGHALEDRPLMRIAIERAVSWGALGPDLPAG